MSILPIQTNNLPIYLQKYTVNILNTDQLRPCNDNSCVSSEGGCCPDNVTPVPPSGECNTGGCAGTIYGCCPYSTEAKIDPEGSNCGTIVGSVLFSTVGAIPSNVPEKRVWELNLSGYLKPNVHKYYIMYDFHNVDYDGKDQITFEDNPIGTFNICGRVLNATKYTNFTFCSETQTLTIIIDTRKWDFRLKRETHFSFNINVNDSAPCESKKSGPPQPIVQNGSINIKDGEHCTLLNGSGDRGLLVWNNNGVLNYGTKENRDTSYFFIKKDNEWYYVEHQVNYNDLRALSRSMDPDSQYVTVTLGNDGFWCDSYNTTDISFYISWDSSTSINLWTA